jgi:hypothetical protein
MELSQKFYKCPAVALGATEPSNSLTGFIYVDLYRVRIIETWSLITATLRKASKVQEVNGVTLQP